MSKWVVLAGRVYHPLDHLSLLVGSHEGIDHHRDYQERESIYRFYPAANRAGV
jgi:hypothetical protein